jgi:hypothetical protein
MGSPLTRRRTRRRRFHLAAIFAAAVYFAGAYVAYEIYRSAWYGEGRVAGSALDEAGGDEPAPEAAPPEPQELAAMRALAARAQQSVYLLESAGGRQASGFVAWTIEGDSYVMTAYQTVAGVLAEGGRTVFVRRGAQFWTGEIVRSHRANGLVLVRVQAELEQPLWQQRGDGERLRPGDAALVVPAEPAGIGEGAAQEQERGRIPVRAHAEPLNLGAPVLTANGRIAGVVTHTEPDGVNRVVPIEAACEAEIRLCA